MNRCPNCGEYLTSGASDCAKCGFAFDPTESSPISDGVLAGVGYVARLVAWLFIGGFFTLGPGIAHGIDRRVGEFVLLGAFWSWAALPIVGLFALWLPGKASHRLLNANRLIWLSFLILLYARWILSST